MSSKKSQKLKNLEKTFNTAQTLVDELGVFTEDKKKSDHFGDVQKSKSSQIVLQANPQSDLVTTEQNLEIIEVDDNKPPEEMFTLSMLKQDFMMVRQSVLKVCNSGQHILDQVGLLDLADLKASQIDALSNMQGTLANNLKLMITIYKDIIDIEKSKAALCGKYKEPDQSTTVVQGDVHQNVIMTGGTHDLLEVLEKQRSIREKELEANGTG